MTQDYCYTMHWTSKYGKTAVLHKGYVHDVDGIPVFLYHDGNKYTTWYCVDRKSGLSITQGASRKAVLQAASAMVDTIRKKFCEPGYYMECRAFLGASHITEDQMYRG